MSKVSDVHRKWSQEPDDRAAYDKLGPKFYLAPSLIEARLGVGLTQAQLARA